MGDLGPFTPAAGYAFGLITGACIGAMAHAVGVLIVVWGVLEHPCMP